MILDGKLVANEIGNTLKKEILARPDVRPPHLVIISVGDDPASKIYVRNKIKKAEELGIVAHCFPMKANLVDTRYVRCIVAKFNNDPEVDGIMVQLPLPAHLDEREIIDTIDPEKDVDGLTTTNIGRLRSGQSCIQPCTAAGVMDLLDYYHIPVEGKDVTIVGRSNIVGKPLADLMMAAGATVTQCHSKTSVQQLGYCVSAADIVVSAVGKPHFITSKWLMPSQTIIDVGINRDENGKLCGDVDYIPEIVGECAITPVPGGVGPMTVIELMKNTVECWRKNI